MRPTIDLDDEVVEQEEWDYSDRAPGDYVVAIWAMDQGAALREARSRFGRRLKRVERSPHDEQLWRALVRPPMKAPLAGQ